MTLSDEIKTILTNKLAHLQGLKTTAISTGDISQVYEIDNKIVEVTNLLQQLA